MITIKNSESLFDRFTASGLNAKQVIQGLATIVQNDGVQLTEAEVDEWAVEATKKLYEEHRKQLNLITNTLHSIKAMKE